MIDIHLLLLQAQTAATDVAGQVGQAAHTGGAGEAENESELINLVTLIAKFFKLPSLEDWVPVIFSFAIMLMIFIFFALAARKLEKIPTGRQNFVEVVMGALDNFVFDVLGKEGRPYVSLIGTLFIYVLVMNLFGIIPLGFSPTSSLNITLSLALCVFVIVQVHGIRKLGIIGYIKHFCDLPKKPNAINWVVVPLMLPLHLIGELAKPVSLSLRLFGNITGEDALIAIFVTLLAFVPFQVFMYPIVLIGSAVQALVFAGLSTVYILMMSPHEE
ncbi:MAG: F0F1 ATP synthase subunit A [bacterium]